MGVWGRSLQKPDIYKQFAVRPPSPPTPPKKTSDLRESHDPRTEHPTPSPAPQIRPVKRRHCVLYKFIYLLTYLLTQHGRGMVGTCPSIPTRGAIGYTSMLSVCTVIIVQRFCALILSLAAECEVYDGLTHAGQHQLRDRYTAGVLLSASSPTETLPSCVKVNGRNIATFTQQLYAACICMRAMKSDL